MKCETVREELVALVQGELDARQARLVRKHLSGCAGCTEEKASVEMLFGMMAHVPDVAPSQHFDEAFEKKLDEARQRRASRIATVLERSEAGWVPPMKTMLKDRVRKSPMLAVSAALHVAIIALLGLLIYAGARAVDPTSEEIVLTESGDPDEAEGAREEFIEDLPRGSGSGSWDQPRIALRWQPQRASGPSVLRAHDQERLAPVIDRGLRWLASAQADDGSWDGELGTTALATQALLAEGNTADAGPQGAEVGRALAYLRGRQRRDGFFADAGASTVDLRAHALVVQALGEHLLMVHGPTEKGESYAGAEELARLRLAVRALVRDGQATGGGWGMAPAAEAAHVEATSWVLALHPVLRSLGLALPAIVLDRALGALERLTGPDGEVGYGKAGESIRGLFGGTSLALLARAAVRPAVAVGGAAGRVLATALASTQRSQAEPWLWQHVTLALTLARAPEAAVWARTLRPHLLLRQDGGPGETEGSWRPAGVVGPFRSRAGTTALALLSLQVPYRYR